MQNETNKQTSPFFSLLAEAEEIKVREILQEPVTTASTNWDNILSAFETSEKSGDFRAFVVKVRQPVPTPETKAVPIESNPDNRDELLRKAKLLLSHSEVLLARHIYSYLLKTNIRDKDALQGLGHCLLQLGDSGAARKCFRAIWEIYQIEECLVYLAICYSLDGDDKTAVMHFEKVKSPQTLESEVSFEFYRQYGNSLVRLAQYDLARLCYEEALKVSPQSDTVYTNVGTLELQMGKTDLASRAFEKAIKLNPKSTKAHCGAGLSAMSENDWSKAKNYFETALDLDCLNTVALGQLWHIAQATDDHTYILPRLKKFLEIQPHSADAEFWLGACFFHQGKWRKAEAAIDRALTIDKTHAGATNLKFTITQNRHQKWEGA